MADAVRTFQTSCPHPGPQNLTLFAARLGSFAVRWRNWEGRPDRGVPFGHPRHCASGVHPRVCDAEESPCLCAGHGSSRAHVASETWSSRFRAMGASKSRLASSARAPRPPVPESFSCDGNCRRQPPWLLAVASQHRRTTLLRLVVQDNRGTTQTPVQRGDASAERGLEISVNHLMRRAGGR